VQLLLPPDSLILVVPPGRGRVVGTEEWERTLLGALSKLGGSEAILAATEEDVDRLFHVAAGVLSDEETGVLYALLRVRQMIRERSESLGQAYLDHDRFAEVCDEESELMQDYLGFPREPFATIRRAAVSSGALGAKLTFPFAGHAGVIVVAPGRREQVLQALARRFADHCILPVNVDPAGLRGES